MLIRFARCFLFCALVASGTVAPASVSTLDGATTWPQRFEKDGNVLLVYQPQMESWQDRLRLAARVAVVVLAKGAGAAAGGAVDLTARTDTDATGRAVVLSEIEVTGAHFKGDDAAAAETVARDLLPRSGVTLSLDYLLAALSLSTEKIPGVAVSNTPPKILFSEQPSRLVAFEGTPVFAKIEGTDLQHALNSNWPVFLSSEGAAYFLLDESGWLTSGALESGTWSYASELPAGFEGIPETEQWKDVRSRIPAAPSDSLPPLDIFIVTEPAELIQVVGETKWKKIEGSELFYAENTSSLLFWEGADKDYYYLVAGRWFRSRKLDGPWTYASRDLPSDFAKLPADGPLAAVRAAVPGTPEAREAAFRATIPHLATVDRKKAKASVTYAGEPQFAPVEGTSLSYAVNSPDDVIRVGDAYYLCENGVWFTSDSANGPWTVADSVPAEIYTISPSSPVYNTTYVRLYDSDDDSVVYGYTDGYTGAYVDDGVLAWGSGYYYPPYVVAGDVPYFYPRAYTYGCDAFYDPVTGAFGRAGYGYGPYGGVGGAAVYNPYTGTYARGVVVHGPDGGTVAYGRAFNPRTGQDVQGVRRYDPYSAWQEAVVPHGPRYVGPRVTPGDQWAVSARRPADQIYAARDGSLYRAAGDRWEAYTAPRRDALAAPREAEAVSSAPREAEVVSSAPEWRRSEGSTGLGGQSVFRQQEEYREMEGERMARQRAAMNSQRLRSWGGGAYREMGGGRFAGGGGFAGRGRR